MQDAVLNLCRVKMRDQQRLKHGALTEYPNKTFGDAVPRAGNASGGGQPGAALKCKPGGPNDYIYVIIQPQVWAPLMQLIGRSELIEAPEYATPEARLNKLDIVFGIIQEWTQQYTKSQVMERLNEIDVPCGPILDMKELIEDKAMAERGMIVDVPHPERGVFQTVGCPLVLSDSPVEMKTSPLLGEHTDEILTGLLGYDRQRSSSSEPKASFEGGGVIEERQPAAAWEEQMRERHASHAHQTSNAVPRRLAVPRAYIRHSPAPTSSRRNPSPSHAASGAPMRHDHGRPPGPAARSSAMPLLRRRQI